MISVAAQILRKLLDLWHKNGDKVLIFSMSLKILSFLEDLMSQTRYEYLVLDGSTPQEDRTFPSSYARESKAEQPHFAGMPLVDEFNDPESDKFCFLISTKAGGVGLNLTAANRVSMQPSRSSCFRTADPFSARLSSSIRIGTLRTTFKRWTERTVSVRSAKSTSIVSSERERACNERDVRIGTGLTSSQRQARRTHLQPAAVQARDRFPRM